MWCPPPDSSPIQGEGEVWEEDFSTYIALIVGKEVKGLGENIAMIDPIIARHCHGQDDSP